MDVTTMAGARSFTLWTGFLLALMPGVAFAQTAQGIVTTLSGRATVARPSLAHPQPLRFKDALFVRDRIDTAERSLMRVLLGGKALITVRELSTLMITEGAGTEILRLSEGKLALGVARSRMRPGDLLEIHTPNAVAAVRGTVLVVEILPSPAPGGTPNTLVTVTRGVVDVMPLAGPPGLAVAVRAGQRYDVAAGHLRPLTPDEIAGTFADLVGESLPMTLSDDLIHGFWVREGERSAAEATLFVGAEMPVTPWATALGQAFAESPLRLITDSGSGLTGRGCGGGVGGGAGAGCSGTGQGAARRRQK
jgi:hypothetical protein